MKLLQLTVIVRDVQTGTMAAHSFTRSPVLLGRQHGNQLRLDARIVSRRHGAFLSSKDGLQIIDYNSANGTFVDGVRIPPNVPVDVRDSALITVAPFQLVTHVDLVDTRRLSNDPNEATPTVALLRPRTPTAGATAWREILDGHAATRSAGSPRDSIESALRARRVIEVLADGMLAAGSRTAATLSPLRLASTPEEIVALLLDAAHADERLAELRDLLAELFRPRLTSVP